MKKINKTPLFLSVIILLVVILVIIIKFFITKEINYYKYKNKCKLPCVLNIIPEQTNWDEAYKYLDSIATMNLGIQNKKLNGDQIAFFRFNDPVKNQMIFEVRLSGNNEIVYDIWINPQFLPIETASNLSNMIEIYGEPSVVLYYLYPYLTPQIKIAPIFIFEDYNFYLAYNSMEALQEGENLKACFEEEPFIYSWNPKFSPFSDSYYRITSMEKTDKQLYFDDIKIVQSSKDNGDECILMDYDLVIKGGR